ncbi:MAG TPA: YkgJ family cysteine cluster protein [Rectinemataceae bacterium]|nr:YkgJ family cysteine cluster protein [Rectinemataceae bacterium]
MFEEAHRHGLPFGCTQCSFCCAGSPGYVWLCDKDIESLLVFLGMDFETFVRTCCKYVEVEGGRALSLGERAGYACVFLDGGKCSVYTARPVQCRTYPFWEEILESEATWKAEVAYCPGIGAGGTVPPEKIAGAILESRSNPRRLFPRNGSEEQR